MSEGKLSPNDTGIAAHEIACRVLETAACYDQVSVTQLACMELVARLIQLTQTKHRERFLPPVGKKGGPVGIEDDAHLYLGTSQTRGRLCICPLLTEHVADKQHVEAMIYKERRKLAEERRLLKNNNSNDPKGE